jgi:hypothetical protein
VSISKKARRFTTTKENESFVLIMCSMKIMTSLCALVLAIIMVGTTILPLAGAKRTEHDIKNGQF